MIIGNLKKAIKSVLEDATGLKVYYNKCINTSNYPYITYKLQRRGEYINLQVHVWTNDIKTADNVANKIEDLENGYYTDKKQSFTFSVDNRIHVDDQSQDIEHININFTLNYFSY